LPHEESYAKLDGVVKNSPGNIDVFVKSRKSTTNVIPAKAGIQKYQMVTKALDPGFRRGDDFLRIHQH
jgi:hypothetical protein